MLWRHEIRRAGWAALLGPPVAVAAGAGLSLTGSSPNDAEAARVLLGTLEMAVPLVAGVASASLVGRDPAAELQLTMPTRYRSTLVRRLVVAAGSAAVVAALFAVVLIATGWWHRWPEHHGVVAGQLTWLAPTLAMCAVGFAAGAVFRGPAAAGAVVTSLWIVQQVLAGVMQQHLLGRLLYLFATTRGAEPGDWPANRLTLLGLAAVLIVLALAVLRRTERLITEGDQ